ncbi:hypothetical protein QTH97_34225 [Variovorax sp. J22R24]|uniref:hypothetical protein n=1 Tax=Variovorax gracilis TaxID=3053502 RepID=UPI0025783C24|nr:hypothetical protein [Variovorax sp. J22R24]MDM0110007.1 hypothetical protein [Variovorax sp. J22R24]
MPAPNPPGNYGSAPGTAVEELSKVHSGPATANSRPVGPNFGPSLTDAPEPEGDKATAVVTTVRSWAPEVNGGSTEGPAESKASPSKAAGAPARQAVERALDATHGFAKSSVDAIDRKVRDVKKQFESAQTRTTEYINDDPVRAVKFAAIGGAVLSAAFVMFARRGR